MGSTRTSILEILRNANSSVSVLRSSRAALPSIAARSAQSPSSAPLSVSRARADARGGDDGIRQELATGIAPPCHWRGFWHRDSRSQLLERRRGRGPYLYRTYGSERRRKQRAK